MIRLAVLLASLVLFFFSYLKLQRLKERCEGMSFHRIPSILSGIGAWIVLLIFLMSLERTIIAYIRFYSPHGGQFFDDFLIEPFLLTAVSALIGLTVFIIVRIGAGSGIRQFCLEVMLFQNVDVVQTDVFGEEESIDIDGRNLENLLAGAGGREAVDISATWRARALGRTSPRFFDRISDVQVLPMKKVLSASVDLPITAADLATPPILRHLKMDLYNLFQAIESESWLVPYTRFYETITLKCYGAIVEESEKKWHTPLLSVSVKTAVLNRLKGTSYDGRDLEKMARIILRRPGGL